MLITSIIFILISTLVLVSILSTKAHAHGYVESPPSRAYRYSSRFPNQEMSWAERMAMIGSATNEPQSISTASINWPTDPNTPRDGQLASANCRLGCQIDRQSRDLWLKTTVTSGPVDFTWYKTAPHMTLNWRYYITKPNWNPDAPLTRDQFDLEPIECVSGNGESPRTVTHTVNIPSDRSGYHIVYAVWDRDPRDSIESFYQVVDLNIVDEDGETGPIPTPPSVPTGLRTTNVGTHSATIAWNASSGTVTGYEIYRDGARINTTGGTTTHFTDNTLLPNMSHSFQVRALGPNNVNSTLSLSLLVRTNSQSPSDPSEGLNPPTNLRVTEQTQSSISIAWNSSESSVVTTYEIFRNNVKIAEVPGNVLTYTDSGLEPGVTNTYTVRVTAVSGPSNTATGTTTETAPPPTDYPEWSSSGVLYEVGDIVTYKGRLFRALQRHTSNAGWSPTLTQFVLWQPI